jgi:tetratricopeptide (TPR) repeat protein
LETDQEFMKTHENLKKIIPLIQEYFYKQERINQSPVRQYLSELESTLPELKGGGENNKSSHSFNLQKLSKKRNIAFKVIHKIENKVVSLFSSTRIILTAACFMLLVAGAIFFVNRETLPPDRKIFEAYFEPYPNIAQPGTMGGESNPNDLNNGYKAYDSKEYANAIRFFEKALDENRDPMILFYTGNAYLALGKDDKAIEKFDFLLHNYSNFILIEQARWYLSLSYLQQGNIEKARSNFKSLENSDNYGTQVRRMMDKLK